MDLSVYRVSIPTIICIIISLLISVGIPMILATVWEDKTHSHTGSALWGAGTFIVFALILESILHNIILKVMGQDAFMALPFYAIYGGLAAGTFEEVGRYIVMRLCMKKTLDKKEAIMFGIGHGGCESILLAGFTCVSNIVISILLNIGQGNLLLKSVPADMYEAFLTQLSPLWESQSLIFFWTGFERIGAIIFHICASYLVYRAIKDKKSSLLLLAILLHALMDGVFVVIQRTYENYLLTESFLLLFAAVFAVFTFKAYLKEVK